MIEMRPTRNPRPIELQTDEQIVHTIAASRLPTLTEIIFASAVFPFWLYGFLVFVHRLFRPLAYVITTRRVIVAEPNGTIDEIDLTTIKRMRGTRKALMIYGEINRVWLSRLPDARFAENLIRRVQKKMSR